MYKVFDIARLFVTLVTVRSISQPSNGMVMSRVEIKIHNDGRVDLNLSDFDGNSCLDTTRTIEHLLGNEIIDRHFLSNQLSETIAANEKKLDKVT